VTVARRTRERVALRRGSPAILILNERSREGRGGTHQERGGFMRAVNKAAWLLWAVGGLAWAGDIPPAPQIRQLKPLPVSGQGITAKLAVDPVKVGLLQGDDLGHMTLGMFCANAQPLTVTEALLKTFGPFVATITTQVLKRLC
jgi:hypothetical protein